MDFLLRQLPLLFYVSQKDDPAEQREMNKSMEALWKARSVLEAVLEDALEAVFVPKCGLVSRAIGSRRWSLLFTALQSNPDAPWEHP